MGTLAIELRKAVAADAEGIAVVHDAAWKNAYSGVLPHKALLRMISRRGSNWWEQAIRRSTVILVLEIGGRIAGYATVGRNRVHTLPYRGEIYELYLLPEFQGVGLGAKLFLAARAELARRGLKSSVVWVLADNEPAIGFYRNAGGREIAEGTEYFDGRKIAKVALGWEH